MAGSEVYVDRIAAAIGGRCGMSVDDAEERRLLRIYAVLALTVGSSCSLADVHHAWAAWRAETRPDHPALVPFRELTREVQLLDRPYRDAIVATAKEIDRVS